MRSLSALTYEAATRTVRAITTISNGNTETSATGRSRSGSRWRAIYDWAEEAQPRHAAGLQDSEPHANKITNLGEFLDDRVATAYCSRAIRLHGAMTTLPGR